MKRDYKIRFSIDVIDDGDSFSNNLKVYIPKWSNFMKRIVRLKLSSIPHNNTISVCELPSFRDYLKDNNINTIDIIPLLQQKRPDLARLLLDAFPMFDKAPIVLKSHILAVFGITLDEIKNIKNMEK
jgi:hypothetical protein